MAEATVRRLYVEGACDGCARDVPLTENTMTEAGVFCAGCRRERAARVEGERRRLLRIAWATMKLLEAQGGELDA